MVELLAAAAGAVRPGQGTVVRIDAAGRCGHQPPEIIGPWFLWKLLIDQRYQGRGYGSEAVRQIARLVQAEGRASC